LDPAAITAGSRPERDLPYFYIWAASPSQPAQWIGLGWKPAHRNSRLHLFQRILV
jgi:hypothetical protein